MAEIGLAVVQTLFAAMQCPELKSICSVWGYESQLEELYKTVTTIKNVLLDAETKLLSKEERGYIKELKDVVYEADDLFDEFVTRLELKQLQGSPLMKGGEFIERVSRFFSFNDSKISQDYIIYHKVKEIQTKLNAIVDNHKRFALGVDYTPICLRGEETCSYVDVKDIIGRDDDKKVVVKMLLESKDHQNVCFLSVVGVGGLGKTALAQLVYNDKDVIQEFGDLRFWVCVSDQDKHHFDVKVILSQILKEVTKVQRSFDAFEFYQLQKELQQELRGKKYMLVLDDVWNENPAKWVDLQKFLMFGERGSRVLVTTRSMLTAKAVGDDDHIYRLQGLSPENSWDLFKMVAFNQGNYQQKEFLEVGEKIVVKCCNIPLAIKVVGSLLYGQHIKKWKSFEEIGLSKIEDQEGDHRLMSVLKFSYYNLQSSLKSCFTYCAVFPKDYEIQKVRLINLWMAQGYIVPADQGGESIANVAEEYFFILLRRCFFQDVVKDEDGHIMSVKIHDLMHDVAQEMAGKEIQIQEFGGKNNIGDEVRHWSFEGKNGSQISSIRTKLRSYICLSLQAVYGSSQFLPNQLKCLRVLELQHLDDIKSLESLGEFLHLRYLHLSYSTFEAFPDSSITKLRNLQTFILRHCNRLSKLPHDFSKLEKLVHIEIFCCNKLQTMPSLGKLLYLNSLVLLGLHRLQYMEKTCTFAGAEETSFFPCLSRLEIRSCPKLATFPPCPVVKTLLCEKLGIVKQVVGKGDGTSWLASLSIFGGLKTTLDFSNIFMGATFYGSEPTNAWDYHLDLLEDDIMLWKALNQSLHTLVFYFWGLETLPKGMQHLTSLQTLKILSCPELNALPEWISCLTSLQDFKILECSQLLYERCCEPSGADWPKIQHIPNITICK